MSSASIRRSIKIILTQDLLFPLCPDSIYSVSPCRAPSLSRLSPQPPFFCLRRFRKDDPEEPVAICRARLASIHLAREEDRPRESAKPTLGIIVAATALLAFL